MRRTILAIFAALSIVTVGTAKAQQTGVVINRVSLTQQEVSSLSSLLGQPLVPGNYWYDTVSGLWGYEGGPMMGQLQPGLPGIRGPLRADASGGQTQVFLNGRALHPQELMQAQAIYGQVMPGRYAMNGQGQVVMEGQPFPPSTAQAGVGGNQSGWWNGNSVYMPGRTGTGAANGLHVGTASDGCTYIVTGGYSAESC